jgi:hypothetical protein
MMKNIASLLLLVISPIFVSALPPEGAVLPDISTVPPSATAYASLPAPNPPPRNPNLDECLKQATARWAERNEPCDTMRKDKTGGMTVMGDFPVEKALQWCYVYPEVEYRYQSDMCYGVTDVSKQQCYIDAAQSVLKRCEAEWEKSKKTKEDVQKYVDCCRPFPRCLTNQAYNETPF